MSEKNNHLLEGFNNIISKVTSIIMMLGVIAVCNSSAMNNKVETHMNEYLKNVKIENISENDIEKIIESEGGEMSNLNMMDFGKKTYKRITYRLNPKGLTPLKRSTTFEVKLKNDKKVVEIVEN